MPQPIDDAVVLRDRNHYTFVTMRSEAMPNSYRGQYDRRTDDHLDHLAPSLRDAATACSLDRHGLADIGLIPSR